MVAVLLKDGGSDGGGDWSVKGKSGEEVGLNGQPGKAILPATFPAQRPCCFSFSFVRLKSLPDTPFNLYLYTDGKLHTAQRKPV